MARLVLNHSTNIEGLIKWLRKLSKNELIQTVTPANIYNSSSNSGKLTIRISRETKEGYKLIARKGRQIQDIYLVTKESKEIVLKMIKESDPNQSRRKRIDER